MDIQSSHHVPYKKRKCVRDPKSSGDSCEDNQRQQAFAQNIPGHKEELLAVLCGGNDFGDDTLKEHAEKIAQTEVNVYPLTKTKRWLDCSQEAVQRLRVNGKLDINGKELQVWICTQSELDIVVDRRRLVLNGLAGDTLKYIVKLYVEAISGVSDDFNIEYLNDGEMAVVTFQKPIDMRCLFQKRSQRKLLNKREIDARLLEVTNCVLVEGVAPRLIDDLHLYFENKTRSGGGELTDVIIKEDERNVYLYFKDWAVVEEIVSRQHVLCTTELKVVPYYNDICSALGKQDQLAEDPGPFYILIDFMVMQFITNSSSSMAELKSVIQQAETSFSHGEDSNGKVNFKPTLDNDTINYQSLAKKWQQTTETCFLKWYDQYSKNDLPCSNTAWERVKQEVSMPDHVLVHYDPEQEHIFIAGRNQDVLDVCKKMNPIVMNAEDKLSKDTQIIIDRISLESQETFRLMQMLNNEADFCAKFSNLHLQFDEESCSVIVTGMFKECQIIANEMHNLLMDISKKDLVISDNVRTFLAFSGVVETMNTHLQKSSIYAVIILKCGNIKNSLTLVSIAGYAEKAESCINEMVVEKSYCIQKAERDSTKTKAWKILLNDLEKSRVDECQQVILGTFEDQDGSCFEVVITGFAPAVENAYGTIHTFSRDNSTTSRFMEMPKYTLEFLEKHELILYHPKLFGKNISVEYEPIAGFRMVGQTSIVNDIEMFIYEKGFKVCSKLLRINMPGAAKYLREHEDFAKSKVSKGTGCMVCIEFGADGCPQYPYLQLKCQEDLPGGHTISIYKGDILKTPVDVVVNAATEKLQILTDGAFGKALLEIGGSDIQMACNELINDNEELKPAEVVITRPGKLPCQNIAHVICGYLKKSTWNVDNSKMKLVKEGIQKVLMEVGSIGHRSVAIPGLLFESYRYPLDVYTTTLIDAVESFCKEEDNADNSLTDILFIDVDDSVLNALANALLCKVGKAPVGNESDRVVDLLVHSENYLLRPGCPQTQSSTTTPISSSYIITNEGLKVSLLIGSIEEADSDVIINTTSANMDMDSGKVSSAIFRKAGPTLQNLVNNAIQGQSIRPAQIVKTDVTGLNLQCQAVYHTTLGSWDNGKHLQTCMERSLEMAHWERISSISFPALGTGNLSYPPTVVSSLMFSEVIKFSQKFPGTTLKDVRFVIFSKDQPVISAFQAELTQHLQDSSRRGLNEAARLQAALTGEFALSALPQTPRVQQMVPPFKTSYQNEVVIVKVFGKPKNNVGDVSQMMKDLVEKECSPKKIQSNYVLSLKDADIKVLENIEADCDVKITLALTHIQIEGMNSDVFSATTKVNKVMHDLEKKHIEESFYASFSKWLYDDNGQMKAFHKAEVIQIEKAFLQDEKQVVINSAAGKLVINFHKYEATNPQGEIIRVKRECKYQDLPDPHELRIDIPVNWASMQKGQEVIRVWLHPQALEYKNVESNFLKSGSTFKIIRIERIQNMGLYHTYQVMKQSIQSRNNEQMVCEQLLFHGTRSNSIDNINHHGFNRSYAGKNATAYGVGTYFAVNSSYSASDTYSKPDANGTKYMYQARVLTGSYCRGDSRMKEPPPKSPLTKAIRYDSVVDNPLSPTMYVVFYDNQAYPEYLITFSK